MSLTKLFRPIVRILSARRAPEICARDRPNPSVARRTGCIRRSRTLALSSPTSSTITSPPNHSLISSRKSSGLATGVDSEARMSAAGRGVQITVRRLLAASIRRNSRTRAPTLDVLGFSYARRAGSSRHFSSSRCDLTFDSLRVGFLSNSKVVHRLEQPRLRIAAKVACKSHGRVCRNSTPFPSDVVYARSGDTQGLSKRVRRQTRRAQEVLAQHLARPSSAVEAVRRRAILIRPVV